MKKTYNIRGIDCAHCAAKMEDAANKLAPVKINFLTEKMTIDFPDDNYTTILDEIVKAIQKIDYEVYIEERRVNDRKKESPHD